MNLKLIYKRIAAVFTTLCLNATTFYFVFNGLMNLGPKVKGKEVIVNIDGKFQKMQSYETLWDSFTWKDGEFWAQWICLFLGIILTIFFLKWLYGRRQYIRQRKDKRQDMYDNYELNNKLSKQEQIDLLLKKAENGDLTKSDIKKAKSLGVDI